MSKRIALLRDGVVFNIVVGETPEEMATLFECEAVEVTSETLPAHIGEALVNGKFTQPVVIVKDPFADENGNVPPPLNESND
jgi:hypothetical protein